MVDSIVLKEKNLYFRHAELLSRPPTPSRDLVVVVVVVYIRFVRLTLTDIKYKRHPFRQRRGRTIYYYFLFRYIYRIREGVRGINFLAGGVPSVGVRADLFKPIVLRILFEKKRPCWGTGASSVYYMYIK